MSSPQAVRFANVSIEMFGHERTFEIQAASEREAEELTQAFQQAGCTVEVNHLRLRLQVTVPKPAPGT
jgi:hypothetical protein